MHAGIVNVLPQKGGTWLFCIIVCAHDACIQIFERTKKEVRPKMIMEQTEFASNPFCDKSSCAISLFRMQIYITDGGADVDRMTRRGCYRTELGQPGTKLYRARSTAPFQWPTPTSPPMPEPTTQPPPWLSVAAELAQAHPHLATQTGTG